MGKRQESRAGLLLLAAWSASGQIVMGDLSGLVNDQVGSPVPGAQVEVVRTEGGQPRQAVSSTRGEWAVLQLFPGRYTVTVTATGFAARELTGVEVAANRGTRLDISLAVASVSGSVTVSAEAEAGLPTDSAGRSTRLSSEQLLNLPLGGQRNFQSLLRLVPGSTPPRAQNSLAGNPQSSLVTNFNGVSYAQNGNRLDGALNYFVALPHHAAYLPPAEAIEAVNIQTNAFDAEQGLAGGAAVNVTIRSGGNRLHGGVWEFHTNSYLRARNFFYTGGNLPKNLLNQFGARLGGPLRKDRLFFYGDYEGNRNRQAANILASVPTEAMRRGDFAGTGSVVYDPLTGAANGSGRSAFNGNSIPASRFAAASGRLAALLPAPNQPGFNNNYFSSGSLRADRDNYDLKLNAYATDRLSLFGRYGTFLATVFDPPTLGPAGGPGITSVQPGDATNRTHSLTAGATYTLTPTLLLDGYFGFTRQKSSGENVDIDKKYGLDALQIPGTNGPNRLEGGYPGFNVSGYTAFGNPNVSNPYQWSDNLFVWAGNVSSIRGTHAIRAGAETTRAEINHFQPQGAYSLRGSFNFTGGLTAPATTPTLFQAWGDFLLGLPQSFGKTTATVIPSSVRTMTHAFYVRDQWRPRSRLAINYGVRFEAYPFSQRPGRGLERYDPSTNSVLIGGLGPTPTNTGVNTGSGHWAPRLGFVLGATSTVVVRAGYGVSIDPFSYGVFMRNVYPVVIGAQYNGANPYQNAGTLATGIPPVTAPAAGSGVIGIPNNVATNTVPAIFRRGYVQSFNLTLEKRFGGGMVADAAYVGTRSIRQMAQRNLNAAGPGGGNEGRALALLFGRTADTTELTPLGTANYNALQASLRRPLSRGVQFVMSYTLSKVIALNDNADSNLFFNWGPAFLRNRAVAGYDRTHGLASSVSWELPFGRGHSLASSRVAAALLGGWQLNTVFSAYSGLPFTVTASGATLNAPGNNQTADQVAPTVGMPRVAGTAGSWFDPTAFQSVNAARFGNSGINSLRGPRLVNMDASVQRRFVYRDRAEAQLRLEAFNVSNTPAFNLPNANVSVANARSLNGFSQITSAQSSERQLRVALRVTF